MPVSTTVLVQCTPKITVTTLLHRAQNPHYNKADECRCNRVGMKPLPLCYKKTLLVSGMSLVLTCCAHRKTKPPGMDQTALGGPRACCRWRYVAHFKANRPNRVTVFYATPTACSRHMSNHWRVRVNMAWTRDTVCPIPAPAQAHTQQLHMQRPKSLP
jgi:hypothetical protein